jgi:hypothetical protein
LLQHLILLVNVFLITSSFVFAHTIIFLVCLGDFVLAKGRFCYTKTDRTFFATPAMSPPSRR